MSCSVAIKHVAGCREQLVGAILAELPRASVVLDDSRNPWDTARRAWMHATGDYHLVLDDDAVLPSGFAAKLDALLDSAAGYLDACALSSSPGLALCMRTTLIPEFLVWCDENIRESYPHDDGRFALWLQRTGRVLNRADLVGHYSGPSLVGYRPSPRPDLDRAWRHARKVVSP